MYCLKILEDLPAWPSSADLTARCAGSPGVIIMAVIYPFGPANSLLRHLDERTGPGLTHQFLKAMAHGWRAFVRYKRLERMSDQELASRDLTRIEIARHAYFGGDDKL